jgi:HK97 family phage portal protein
MGIIQRIKSALNIERRSEGAALSIGAWDSLFPASAGQITARTAENISTVLACTSAIATALAYIPALVYSRDDKGNRIEATGHPLTRLTHSGVNEQMTWPELIEHWVASALLHGNGLIEIVSDQRGELSGLMFHPWGNVSVQRLMSGRLAYEISEPFMGGRSRRLLQSEVIHLRDRTDDGYIGRSRLSRANETVQTVAAAGTFARSFLQKGGYPAGVIRHPGQMSKEAKEDLRAGFNTGHAGSENAGKVMILDGGLEWMQAQVSPEDMELLESRRFGVEEICRLFQVPPPLVQDYSHNTFTNSETAGRWFAQFTLAPWARKIEAAVSQSIFSQGSGLELEMDLSGFLRGDPAARWQSHKIAVEAGILDPDEVRQMEGWNARRVSAAI